MPLPRQGPTARWSGTSDRSVGPRDCSGWRGRRRPLPSRSCPLLRASPGPTGRSHRRGARRLLHGVRLDPGIGAGEHQAAMVVVEPPDPERRRAVGVGDRHDLPLPGGTTRRSAPPRSASSRPAPASRASSPPSPCGRSRSSRGAERRPGPSAPAHPGPPAGATGSARGPRGSLVRQRVDDLGLAHGREVVVAVPHRPVAGRTFERDQLVHLGTQNIDRRTGAGRHREDHPERTPRADDPDR